MKKIILILSLCLSLLGLSSITYAAEWNWIASNDSTTILIKTVYVNQKMINILHG